jgi:hypothetical protein
MVEEPLPLPDPSWLAAIVGAILRSMETRDPGIVDEMLGSLQDDMAKAAIVRLRGPRQAPEVAAAHAEAHAWLATFAELIERPRRRKR